MLVEDVLTPTSCVCRTEEGRIVDGESLVHLNLACFYFFHIAFNDVKDPCAVIIKWPVCVPVRCEAGHAWNSRPKKWQWNHHGCPGWAERTGKQKIICIDVHPLFFLSIYAVFCCSRWAVFFSETRTNAEQWFSSTDMRRKCSLWTMTLFVTMLEGHNLNYCFL